MRHLLLASASTLICVAGLLVYLPLGLFLLGVTFGAAWWLLEDVGDDDAST